MTDWSRAEYYGPNAQECEERRKRTLEGQAQRAAGQEQRIRRFIDGEGGDPETGTAIVSPGQPAEAPKPARAEIEAKLKAAKDKLAKLRRQAK